MPEEITKKFSPTHILGQQKSTRRHFRTIEAARDRAQKAANRQVFPALVASPTQRPENCRPPLLAETQVL